MREYLLTLFVAAAVTYLLTPLVRRLALSWGALAGVRDRDVHATPTPRLGGLAMFAGFAAALLVASQLRLLSQVFTESRDWLALLAGGAIVALMGVADDKWDLDAVTKLAGQVLAAGVMTLLGVQLLWLPIGGEVGTYILPSSLSTPLTIFIVVATINAVNFVDGLDGLAAGIVGISAAAFFGFSYLLSVVEGLPYATTPTLVTAILVGVCVGFLPHNFHPARIFMGDTGSQLIGLLLAASTVTLTGKVEPNLSELTPVPALFLLAVPVLVLVVPFADLVLAVVRRTRAGRSPFAPDKEHLHHRLLEIGHSQRRAVLIMYAWSGLLAVGVLVVALIDGIWPALIVGGALAAALIVTLNLDQRRRGIRRLRLTAPRAG